MRHELDVTLVTQRHFSTSLVFFQLSPARPSPDISVTWQIIHISKGEDKPQVKCPIVIKFLWAVLRTVIGKFLNLV